MNFNVLRLRLGLTTKGDLPDKIHLSKLEGSPGAAHGEENA